jgi:histidine triad (HIT) family protein
MVNCVVCSALGDPGQWDDIRIHKDALVLLAHVPPSSDGAIDGYPGHLLLLPCRHVESPSGLSVDEAERIGVWLSRGSRALESSLGAEHIYLARLGDGWPHLHFHILPRYAGTPATYRGMNVRDWPGIARCNRPQAAAIAQQLRRAVTEMAPSEPGSSSL